MKKVLVTGGAGFIGSHLVQRLLEHHYQVRVLDDFRYGSRAWLPKNIDIIEGDIANIQTCEKAMKDIDGIFHCAAMSRAAPSHHHIEECTRTNVQGTQNILSAAKNAGVKKIIYSGSSTYYGSQPPPHHETNTKSQFLNYYALTKYMGEKICLFFDEIFDLPCIILRYFNVYGPRQPEEGPYALVLGIFLKNLKNNKPLEIHGTGEKRRDFVHVDDVVTANIVAYESDARHEIFNVGSGINYSIKELADLISPNQIHTLDRKSDAQSTLADINHIKKILKWTPTTTLQDGIKDLLSCKKY